jgi:hypothetical protein
VFGVSSSGKRWAKISSVVIMGSCFFVGTVLAVGHHFYYQWLNGSAVGNSARQQWALRYFQASVASNCDFMNWPDQIRWPIRISCCYTPQDRRGYGLFPILVAEIQANRLVS